MTCGTLYISSLVTFYNKKESFVYTFHKSLLNCQFMLFMLLLNCQVLFAVRIYFRGHSCSGEVTIRLNVPAVHQKNCLLKRGSLLHSRLLGCHVTLPPKKQLLTSEHHSLDKISQSQLLFHFQECFHSKFALQDLPNHHVVPCLKHLSMSR